jgi:uncharacterized membrane protein YbhN (UPF0104 family)
VDPDVDSQVEMEMISGKTLVRRWGWRAIGLAVTGIGLYLVAPSLLTMFGAWPQLAGVAVRWFVVLAVLELCSFAALWWLARIALAPEPRDASMSDGPVEVVPHLGWGTTATAQLAGNAASKVVPGGAATGGVVQARVLISAGQPAVTVASGLTAVNLLGTAVLLLLPVLTIPALIIGPPPARQLQLGLLVSVILASAIVAIGVTALTWPRVVAVVGRGIGRTVHVVRASVTPEGFADTLLTQRDRIAAAFQAHWWRATVAAAANRMFDYAALVAALVAFKAHVRPAEVLLAYVVAQAFALVPITPGGVGFVDAGLTTLLVLVGVPADTALIGVLLYRLFSFWLPIPLGALAWAGWRTKHRG